MNASCRALRLGDGGDERRWFNKNATCEVVCLRLYLCVRVGLVGFSLCMNPVPSWRRFRQLHVCFWQQWLSSTEDRVSQQPRSWSTAPKHWFIAMDVRGQETLPSFCGAVTGSIHLFVAYELRIHTCILRLMFGVDKGSILKEPLARSPNTCSNLHKIMDTVHFMLCSSRRHCVVWCSVGTGLERPAALLQTRRP